jgi:hypothetical protein
MNVGTAAASFSFREADHSYWIGAERILGCSEVLQILGILNTEWYDDRGVDRGLAVHRHTAVVDAATARRARLTRSQAAAVALPGPWSGYADSWQAYVTERVRDFLLVEQPLCDAYRRLAGRPDRIAILHHPTVHLAVLDLKTGDVEPWHRFQQSIYVLLVHAWITAKRPQLQRLFPDVDFSKPPVSYGVYLRADGKVPKVRTFAYEPTTQALITAAQVTRSLIKERVSTHA